MPFPALIVLPVSNIGAATSLYRTLLGIDPYYADEYYAGFRTETGEIGLDPNAAVGGPLPYWDVDDLDATMAALQAHGATVVKEPAEVGGGLTIAVLADADGNPLGLRWTAKGGS
ncbi:MAG: VOC family protein [Thermomicrobiales bacterium]|nr:VOC family protein [Thermomicrobiales bacterium]